MLPTSGIYKITCTANDNFYIGQSVNLKSRSISHLNSLSRSSHRNNRLQRCYDKYGESSFEFTILKECPTEWLDKFEQIWLDQYISHPNCMNIAKDASSPGRGLKRSPESIARMKVAANLPHRLTKFRDQALSNKAFQERRDSVAKKVRLVSPESKVFTGSSVRGFCREHNLSDSCITQVVNGNRNSHKGWSLNGIIIPRNQHQKKSFKLIDPSGDVIEFTGITQFCNF